MSNSNTSNKPFQAPKYSSVKIMPLYDFLPPKHHQAVFKDTGSFLSMRYMQNKVLCHAKKISKTQFMNTKTGEIFDYTPMSTSDKKKVRRRSLVRTFDELRGIIRLNFDSESKNQLFICLTFANQTTDSKEVYDDFRKFMKRLRAAYPEHKFDYVCVVEPHGSGAWHIHVMLKTDQPSLYIPDADIRRIWQYKGVTSTQRLKSDDVGNYYCSYFTGLIEGAEHSKEEQEFLEIEPDTGSDILETELELEAELASTGGLSKKYIKGARLDFYPSHFKFYRCSVGIAKPEAVEEYIQNMDLDTLDLSFSRGFSIMREGEVGKPPTEINRIFKATYRKKDCSPIFAVEPPLSIYDPIAEQAVAFEQLRFEKQRLDFDRMARIESGDI